MIATLSGPFCCITTIPPRCTGFTRQRQHVKECIQQIARIQFRRSQPAFRRNTQQTTSGHSTDKHLRHSRKSRTKGLESLRELRSHDRNYPLRSLDASTDDAAEDRRGVNTCYNCLRIYLYRDLNWDPRGTRDRNK